MFIYCLYHYTPTKAKGVLEMASFRASVRPSLFFWEHNSKVQERFFLNFLQWHSTFVESVLGMKNNFTLSAFSVILIYNIYLSSFVQCITKFTSTNVAAMQQLRNSA
jgi:hypothetical protein